MKIAQSRRISKTRKLHLMTLLKFVRTYNFWKNQQRPNLKETTVKNLGTYRNL
jgi:hypothetical protein